MKRIKKILSLFFLVFLTFIFIFPNAQALSNRTDAVSTNNHTSLTIGSLSFSNITFQNGSSSSSFGLTADVINTSSNDIQYKATIYYYDINYNIMTMESFNNTASQGQSKFNSTSSFSVFENNTVQDIKYYRLEVNIINPSLANSLGWIPNPPIPNQLLLPFLILPSPGIKTSTKRIKQPIKIKLAFLCK